MARIAKGRDCPPPGCAGWFRASPCRRA